jgi:hypothetical protein
VARYFPDLATSAAAADSLPDGINTGLGRSEVQPTTTGRFFSEIVFLLAGPSDCSTAQLRVFDVDAVRVYSVHQTVTNHPYESGVPLVTSSETVDVAPTAIACSATGEKRGGPVSGLGVFPTPEDALEMWLEIEPGHAQDGWVELKLPDGSIAYAHIVDAPPRPELGWVAVVHAVKSGDGWTIDSWEGSGC